MVRWRYCSKESTTDFYKLEEETNWTKEISIVIPTYNEKDNILKLVNRINNTLKGKDFEIVVVDDNSPDGTGEILDNNLNKNIVALHRTNKGIFSAIMDGIKVAKGKILVLMDADFSHPPEKIPELIEPIGEYDMVNASRFMKGAGIATPFHRKLATLSLNRFLRMLLRLGVTDLTGNFYAIKREAWQKIHLQYDAIWGEFGMEVFKEARLNNFKIKEIPFTYDFRAEGKSKSENLLKYGWVYIKRAFEMCKK